MFKFTIKKYFALISALLLVPIVLSVVLRSLMPLILFVVFALAGVLGETLFSMWWYVFYGKKFWVYRVKTLVHSYTSLLNFIPWAVGGMIYMGILYFIFPSFFKIVPLTAVSSPTVNLPFYVIFGLCFLAGLAIQLLVWIFVFLRKGRKYKFKNVTLANYLFFCLPFALPLSVCALLYGSQFLAIAFLFAVIAAIMEYLFGKIVEFVLSKKLWNYNYEAIDNGHFTPLSLVPFSLAGFYFWAIALVVIGFM